MHKVALFDLDGTVFLTEARNKRVHEQTALQYGGQIEKADWAHLAGTSDSIIWGFLSKKFNGFALSERDYVAKIEEGYVNDQDGVILRPGMRAVFDHVSKHGYQKAIVTNSPLHIALKTLQRDKVIDEMDFILTKTCVEKAGLRTKPSGDPFRHASKVLNAHIVQIYEDSNTGSEAAINSISEDSHAPGHVVQIIDQGSEAQIYMPAKHGYSNDLISHVHSEAALVAACMKLTI